VSSLTNSEKSSATILIASDRKITAELVKKGLKDEFENIFTSGETDELAADFDRQRIDVLVLAFDSIARAKRHNLELHRESAEIHRQLHRTLILCNKSQAQEAYELCREGSFDDYILFWPLNYDSPRLHLAVHRAVHELVALRAGGPTPTEFATQVKRLAELEILLKQRMSQGNEQIESTGRAIAEAAEEIGTAFDGFSKRLVQGELSALVEVKDAKGLEQAFGILRQEHLEVPLHAMAEAVQPLKHWAGELQQASAPHLASIRILNDLAARVQHLVMVVDDEKFQFDFVSRMLKDEPYRLVFATGGTEAMKILRKVQPDLLLIDLQMPKMDGLDVIRWMKGSARYSSIPIIMITSNSEESIVEASLQAGAIGFMVKPLTREALTLKIANVLGIDPAKPVGHRPEFDVSDL
jgi:CheY-like chemotaxis protein